LIKVYEKHNPNVTLAVLRPLRELCIVFMAFEAKALHVTSIFSSVLLTTSYLESRVWN